MFRGTTPQLVFKLDTDLDLDTLEQVWVTLHSAKYDLTKDLTQVSINNVDKTITVPFSQDDTLAFSAGTIKVQMRLLTNNGSAYATPISEITMEKILKDGVING